MRSQNRLFEILKLSLSVLLLGLVSACDSEGTRELPEVVTDTTAPEILSVTPSSESTGIEVDTFVEITFSEKVDTDTVVEGISFFSGVDGRSGNPTLDARNYTLSFETVAGENTVTDEASGKQIDVDVTKARLTPANGRFSLNAQYLVKVSTEVSDLVVDDLSTLDVEANYLEAEQLVSFTTEPGVWGDIEIPEFRYLSDDGTQSIVLDKLSYEPILRGGLNGDVLLVWRQIVSGVGQIWMSRYLANDKAWVSPFASSFDRFCRKSDNKSNIRCVNAARVDLGNRNTYSPNVAVNSQGHVALSWFELDENTGETAISLVVSDGENWSTPSVIASGVGSSEIAGGPECLLDDQGTVVCVWVQSVDGDARVLSLSHVITQGAQGNNFEAPVLIDGDSLDLSMASELSLSHLKTGGFIAAWTQEIAGSQRVRINRLVSANNNGFAWEGAIELDSPPAGGHRVSGVKIASATSGDLAAVWRENNGSQYDLLLSRFVANSWRLPELVEGNDFGAVIGFDLAYNPRNRLFVAWSQQVSDNQHELHVKSFHFSTGFTSLSSVSSPLVNGYALIDDINIVFDQEGNGTLLWGVEGLTRSVVASSGYSILSESWASGKELGSTFQDGLSTDLNIEPLFSDGRLLTVWAKAVGFESSLASSVFMEEIAEIN